MLKIRLTSASVVRVNTTGARSDVPETVTESLPYHRLGHAVPRPRWWRPLLALLLSGAFFLIGMLGLITAFALAGSPILEDPLSLLDLYDPANFALNFLLLILLLPSVLAGFRIVGWKPVGLLHSVAGRLRWRWMARCVFPAAVIMTLVLGAMTALDLAIDGPIEIEPAAWLLFALILLLTPLQAAAEEYAFRGALMQAIGQWLRHPAWAILLPAPLFILGHAYNAPGQISVGVFAIAMGWVTWRTGGLEAAIVLHIANNLWALLHGAIGLSNLNSTDVGWLTAVSGSLVPIVYAVWIELMWRRSQSRPSATREIARAVA